MSTLKITNLQNASAASPAIVLDANSRATLNGLSYPTEGSLSGRNRIINGAMVVDARNAGAAVTITGGTQTFPVDRFCCDKGNLSTLVATAQQASDAPSGFVSSLKVTITTAQASGTSSFLVGADQRIEGYNWADMAFGTASAKSFTMSFWVKSSVIGTYPISFFNAAVNRAYLATYSISSANTWEYKTIAIPGDTSGTWNTTNGIGLGFQMTLGGGTDANGTAGSWGSTYKGRTSACVDLNATLNATWQITGIQIEAGSVATPFERRSYGQELALCQRYFVKLNEPRGRGVAGTANSIGRVGGSLPVTMRIAPNLSMAGSMLWFDGFGTGTFSSFQATYSTPDSYEFDAVISGTTAQGRPSVLYWNTGSSYSISASAEL